jgi:hypothetical protein
VRQRLGEHKTPQRVVFVDDLPRNASGEVLKRELRDRLQAEATTTEHRPARDAIESAICAVWEEVLGLEQVGIDHDFFNFGGHSLASAQIAARLADAYGVSCQWWPSSRRPPWLTWPRRCASGGLNQPTASAAN